MRKILAYLACFLLISSVVKAQDVNDIIENVQETYDKMKFFSAVFKQIETFKITGSQTEMLGHIYIANGEKYRFESDEQIIITDGENVWAYSSKSNQVIIDKVKENSAALLPRDILFKYPKQFYATLLSEDKHGDQTIFTIKLDPKEDTHGYVKSVKLWIDKKYWLIHKIEAVDLRGNSTLFEISKIDTKNKIPDSYFSYENKPGVEVVDRR